METLLTDQPEQGLTVIIGWPDHSSILELIARLAVHAPLRLIVGGNRFDAQQLSRLVRRHTLHLDLILERIHLARPFTCYQVITLLEQTRLHTPLIFLDMLTMFYDENISDQESVRLVRLAMGHLRQFKQQAPVLVTLRPTPIPTRQGLMQIVQQAADQVIIYTPPDVTEQPTLW